MSEAPHPAVQGEKSSVKRRLKARGTGGRASRASDPARNRELARIHILAAELNLDREAYEGVLWTIGRVESSKDLDAHGRRTLIEHLESRLPKLANVPGKQPRTLGQRPMLRKIGMQLAAAGRPWNYAEELADRIAHKAALEFCSDAELRKIIAALAFDAKRRAAA